MEEIAQVYSRSLFEVAKEHGKLDVIKQQLDQFTDALEHDRQLSLFFFSPYFSTEEKKQGLERALVDAEPTFVNFLELLIEKHRMPVIYRVRHQFEALWEAEHRLLPVEVTSAITLDPSIVEELGRKIREQTGQNVELTSHIDPDILGGIVLRVGNSILDASIRNRLQQLRREVAKAT
jgi:F-type H+-transporting ATPase subunit delta